MAIVLPTPLLKAPFLLYGALNTYRAMTPPTRPAAQDEKKQASVPDFLGGMSSLQRNAIRTVKVCYYYQSLSHITREKSPVDEPPKLIFCALAVAEATILLAQQLPPHSFLPRVVSELLQVPGLDCLSLRPTATSVVGSLFAIVGGQIRVQCFQTLGRLFTFELAIREGHKLVTTGPYGVVRHPSYTGGIMVVIGNLMLLYGGGSFFVESGLLGSVWGKALAALVTLEMCWLSGLQVYRTVSEDTFLRKQFGEQWDEWAQQTPYRLIPWLY